MQETQEMQVWSLGRKAPLEKEMATHSSIILPGESPWTEEPWGIYSLWSCKELDMIEQLRTWWNSHKKEKVKRINLTEVK